MASSITLTPLLSFLFATLLLPYVKCQDYSADFLQIHNEIRADVNVGPLVWDNDLAEYAQNYADLRAADCQLIHSGGPYGENIYTGWGDGYTSVEAAMSWWANEKLYYDYDTNTCYPQSPYTDCLHYTQIVWSNSTRLGCARVYCTNSQDQVFITCNFFAPGNILGLRPYP